MISVWCQQTLLFRLIDVMIVLDWLMKRATIASTGVQDLSQQQVFTAAVTCPTPHHFYPLSGEPSGFTSRDLKVLYRLAANLTVDLVDN